MSLLRLHRYHSNNDTTSGMAELKKLTFVPKIAEDMRGNLYEMKANEKKMKGNEKQMKRKRKKYEWKMKEK